LNHAVLVAGRIIQLGGAPVLSPREWYDPSPCQLYGVQTRDLNKAVRRNSDRFPSDFMFQLTPEEYKNLMYQFGTSRWGGTRKLHYAFAEWTR
jgi:hypothetical protein